jgi:epoxide hydrolase-like predicted phosphatase
MFFRKKQKVDTVFFDIGGVVVDAPMEHYRTLGAEVFGCRDEHLVQCSAEFLPQLEMGLITSAEFWEKVGQKLAFMGMGRMVEPWRFKGFWEGIMLDTLSIHREVVDLSVKLRSKTKVAALSNTIQEHALVLQRQGVYQTFNPVILSCQVGMRKPNADIYHKAAELTRAKPARCLLIDDLPENVEGAIKAGFQAILYKGNCDELRHELHRMGLL